MPAAPWSIVAESSQENLTQRYLQVEKGPNRGERHLLTAGRTVIGRGRESGLRIDDPGSSREHCALEADAGGVDLVDLGSKNGTSVNGIPVERRRLEPGDEIRLGEETRLVYVEEEPEELLDSQPFALEPAKGAEETLSFELDSGSLRAPEEPGDLWLSGALSILYSACEWAREIDTAEAFFRRLVAAFLERTPAVDGAVVLADPKSPGSGALEVWARPEKSGKTRLLSEAVDAVFARKSAAVLGSPPGPQTLAVPVWIEGEVRGLLALEFLTHERVPGRFLELVAVLGNLLGLAVQNQRKVGRIENEKRRLRSRALARYEMVGVSSAMRRVFATIERIAPTDSTVLVTGESGTGKELVARAIHNRSTRRNGPFEVVNAAAIAVDLVESELFGHEKGAFTGALRAKEGRFEAAHGGTLFLDEVGELDIRAQAKFLRVLENRTFHRVGATKSLTTDARVVAATKGDLPARIAAGSFREDLYYRLAVVEIRLAPLRERPEDIPVLAGHVLARISEEIGKRVTGISDGAMAKLAAHPWPGNVRELANAIERALVLAPEGAIEPEHLDFLGDLPARPRAPAPEEIRTLEKVEIDHIARALEAAGGNKKLAAKLLGIDRSTLYLKLRKMGDSGESPELPHEEST